MSSSIEPRRVDEGLDIKEEFESYNAKPVIADVDRGFIHEERDTPFKYWLSSYAMNRITANQNFILLVVGPTGSGKSYTTMELACDMDPYFNADRIVFHPRDFITVTKQGLPRGSVIMWDEVGVGLSSRDWFTVQNKMIAYVLETFRRDNLILLMTTPNIAFIDKKVRALLHGFGETIDRTFTNGEFGHVKYFHIISNLREGTMMYRYPRIRDKHGRTRILRGQSSIKGNMVFSKAPEWLTDAYEEKKLKFTEDLKDTALDALTESESSVKLEIPQLIDVIGESPREFGLLDDTPEGQIINTAFIRLTLKHPDKKIIKSHVASVVKYIMNDQGITAETPTLKDDMLGTVLDAYNTESDARGVAKALDTDVKVIKKSVKNWKDKGMWPTDA